MQFLISELRLHEIESTGFGIHGLNQLRALWELHLRKKMPSFLPSPATELPSSPVVRNLVTAVPPLLSPPKRRQKVVSADGKTERGNNSRSRRRSEGGNEATDC